MSLNKKKRNKQTKHKRNKGDDSMAISKPVDRAFTIKASKVKEFNNASNKKDIEKIFQIAKKFDERNNKDKK